MPLCVYISSNTVIWEEQDKNTNEKAERYKEYTDLEIYTAFIL